jgi:DoxX-like family
MTLGTLKRKQAGVVLLRCLLSTQLTIVGVMQMVGAEPVATNLRALGYPDWFRVAIGLVQVICVAGLWPVPTRRLASTTLVLVLIGAVASHLWAGDAAAKTLPAAVTLGVAAVLAIAAHRDNDLGRAMKVVLGGPTIVMASLTWCACGGSASTTNVDASTWTNEVIATFVAGDFLESIATTPDGGIYVCATLAAGSTQVIRVAPGAPAMVATMPATCNLATRSSGELLVSSGVPGQASSVWRIDLASQTTRQLAQFAEGAWANGIATLPDGSALVADSAGGRIWRLRPPEYAPEIWLDDPLLKPDPSPPDLPAANGIEVSRGSALVSVLVSNSDAGTLLRVALDDDDHRPGAIEVVARGIAIDDFAVRATDGTVFATTHLSNTVLELSPGRQGSVIIGASDGALGPSSADVGRADGDTASLYVVTDGNLFGNRFAMNGQPIVAPVVMRLVDRTAEPGPR